MRLVAALGLALLGACSFRAPTDGRYTCDPGALDPCPGNLVCSPSGSCQTLGALLDAGGVQLDAGDGQPDAGAGQDGSGATDAPAADAPTPAFDAAPDAMWNEIIATFGETPSATHQGVTRDTRLQESDPDFNYGTNPALCVRASQGGIEQLSLIRFDVSALPIVCEVVSASFTLTERAHDGDQAVEVRALTQPWEEGTSDDEQGVASYVAATSSTLWDLPGARGASVGPPLDSFLATAAALQVVDLPAATVQAWLRTPSQNFGVALVAGPGEIGDICYESRENSAAAVPVLTVTAMCP